MIALSVGLFHSIEINLICNSHLNSHKSTTPYSYHSTLPACHIHSSTAFKMSFLQHPGYPGDPGLTEKEESVRDILMNLEDLLGAVYFYVGLSANRFQAEVNAILL